MCLLFCHIFRTNELGMFICSRYFVTARLEIVYPCDWSNSQIIWSESGLCLSSPSTSCRTCSCIDCADTVALPWASIPCVKKPFSGRTPFEHCRYFPRIVRLIVDVCTPTRSATIANVIGTSVSSPMKYARCISAISRTHFSRVSSRWRIFCTKTSAARYFCSKYACVSASSVLSRSSA